MLNFTKDKKVKGFINKLERSIIKYNKSKQGYKITSSTIKNDLRENGSSLSHQIIIEIELSESEYTYFYSLKKIISVPFNLDISNMTVEKIDYDLEKLKTILKSEKISRYDLTKTENSMLTHPTILAKNGKSTVTGGFEIDYIYPVIKQNNPNSSISDKDLNSTIQNSKTATEFLNANSKFTVRSR